MHTSVQVEPELLINGLACWLKRHKELKMTGFLGPGVNVPIGGEPVLKTGLETIPAIFVEWQRSQ